MGKSASWQSGRDALAVLVVLLVLATVPSLVSASYGDAVNETSANATNGTAVDAGPAPEENRSTADATVDAPVTEDVPPLAGESPGTDGASKASTQGATTRALEVVAASGWWVAGGLAIVGARRAWKRRAGDEEPEKDAGRQALEQPGLDGILRLGQRALDAGKPATAEAWFATALEVDEELAIAALCRGLCHVEMDQPRRARAWLSRALDLEPGNGTARFHLARAQALDGAGREAARTLAPLVRAQPGLIEDVREDPAFEALCEDPSWLEVLDEPT